jgi:hypothetical protein
MSRILTRPEPRSTRTRPAPTSPRPGRDRLYVGLLVAVGLALWLPRLAGPLDMRYDAGVYYILGTSLAEGHGYRLLNEPGAIQAIQYPPLLPIAAGLSQVVAGTSAVGDAGHLLRLAFFVCFLLYAVATYAMARRFLPPALACVVGLVTLLHVHSSFLSDLFFAELPFALLSLLFVLALARSGETRAGSTLAGVLAVAAYLLRTIGIALFAAWVGEALLRRRWASAARRAAVALIVLAAWQGYVRHVEAGAEYAHPAYPYQRASYQYYNVGYFENLSYIDPFVPELGKASAADWARRLGTNLLRMPTAWGEAVSSRAEWSTSQIQRLNHTRSLGIPTWLVQVPLLALGILIAWGLVLLALRGETLISLYVAGSVAVMCLTPWPGQFERYLSPLTPFLALGLFVGLLKIRERLSTTSTRRWRRAGALLPVAVAAFVLAQESFALYKVYSKKLTPVSYRDGHGETRSYRLFFYTGAWHTQDGALDWLAAHGRPGEVIATSTPHWAYLKTGLPAVLPPFEPDPRRAQQLLDSVPVTWLVVDSLEFVDVGQRYARPVPEAFPGDWSLAYAAGDSAVARVYRREPSAGGPTAEGKTSP